jgi:hypothetical protein
MRTVAAIMLSVLTAAALALGAAAPASAATAGFLEYSTNGASWSTTAPSALFQSSLRLSPGDSKSTTIYLRSTRTNPTTMSAAISKLVTSEPGFGAVVTIGASGSTAPGWSKPASALSACQPIFTGVHVAANQVVPVTVTLTLSDTVAGVQQQGAWIRFALLLGLGDVGAPTGPGGCPVSATSVPAFNHNGPTVAFTGTDTLYPGLIFAGFAAGLGVLFLVAAIRRRRVAA